MRDINVVSKVDLNHPHSFGPMESITEKYLLHSLNSLLIFINRIHNVTSSKDKVLLKEFAFCGYFNKIIKQMNNIQKA